MIFFIETSFVCVKWITNVLTKESQAKLRKDFSSKSSTMMVILLEGVFALFRKGS